MANACHIQAKNCGVRIWDSLGASLNIGAHGNNVDISYTADDLETTAYGDTTHVNLAGLRNFSVNYSGWWSGSDNGCVASAIFELIGACGGTMIAIAPAGSAAGSLGYMACVNIPSHDMGFPVDGIATMSFTATPRAGSLSACLCKWG